MGGPGETQIETDRRILADKMTKLRRELDSVRRTRDLHRKRRAQAPWPVVALVGYTNAGKSSLFNALSDAKVLAKDMPFATLDPTTRAVRTPAGRNILLSDTVGFITDLPTELIAAFRATLEEVVNADVLIHVRDIIDPDHEGRKEDVEAVLEAIGVQKDDGQILIEAWNKCDGLDAEHLKELRWQTRLPVKPDRPQAVLTSAVSEQGFDALLEHIDAALSRHDEDIEVHVPAEGAEALAWLFENGQVLKQDVEIETGLTRAIVRLGTADAGRFRQRFGDYEIDLLETTETLSG